MNFVVVVPQSDYFHCKHFVMVDIVQFLFTPKKETHVYPYAIYSFINMTRIIQELSFLYGTVVYFEFMLA